MQVGQGMTDILITCWANIVGGFKFQRRAVPNELLSSLVFGEFFLSLPLMKCVGISRCTVKG
ncbi:hypothetical protein D3C80_2102480 [compost metagenome]